MQTRWLLFVALAGSHLSMALVTPQAIAPAVAGTIYVPLMLFDWAGLPVFSAAESGGWPAPSMLGWAIVVLVWLAIWWAVASLLSRLFPRLSRDA